MHLIDPPTITARAEISDEAINALKESFADVGQLQPIGLREGDGRFEVVYGHTRFLAADALHWQTIEAKVYAPGEEITEAAKLAENIIRTQIGAVDEALFFAELYEKAGQDIQAVARQVRRSEGYVSDRLLLLQGDPEILKALQGDKLSFSVARILNQIGDEQMRRYHLDVAVRSGMTAKAAAEAFNFWKHNHAHQPLPAKTDAPAEQPEYQAAPAMACCICGGSLDPYNLVSVLIHRRELEEIREVLKEQARG